MTRKVRMVEMIGRGLVAAAVLVLAAMPALAKGISVSSFYGKYDVSTKQSGQQALSLRGPKIETWQTPGKVNKSYTIGVSFPHLKDSYWLAVNHGIMDEAKNVGVGIRLKEAGGYTELVEQQAQVREMAGQGVDGIILGSISYTGNNSLVSEIRRKKIPVVEVINDIEAAQISAKALVSFYDMGYFAGEFLAEQVEAAGGDDVAVLFLPGPKGSGWADETLVGFRAATEFSDPKVVIKDIQWGDTGAKAQTALLKQGLAAHPKVDFIVGNAVAADAATDVLAEAGLSARVIATYITPPVYDKIKTGRIAAAPSDMTVDQARMAVGMMVRLLNGERPGEDFPFRSGPMIPVIHQGNIGQYSFERLFGPRGFTPVFSLEP